MSKLNVFSSDNFCSWRYPDNWIKNIRTFFRQFKWAYQRVTKGYCECDWYDLDTHLTMLMADAITDLANNGMSYPGTDEFDTPEKWETYLKRIAYKLRYSLEDLPNEYREEWDKGFDRENISSWINQINHPTPEEKELSDKFFNKEMENEKKKYQAQLEALDMIKHVWGQLWD